MYSLLSLIILLCLWNSILFFNQSFGINVILFVIPFTILFTYIFKKKELIKNKWGLLFNIPIFLVAISYLLYDNAIFNAINIFVLNLLFIFMFIFTINPTYKIDNIISDFFSIVFEPLGCIGNVFRLIKNNKKKESNTNTSRLLKSLIIVIPVVLFVIFLLSSADEIFGSFFKDIVDWMEKLTIKKLIGELINRFIIIFILFIYLSALVNYLIFKFKNIHYNETTKIEKIYDNFTLKMLFTALNIIYVLFDIIQIRSLMLHNVSMNITYSEYARRGFFELMIVSFINLIIILIAKKRENKENNAYNRVNSIVMIFLTLVIIASSFIRMMMYQNAYGVTYLRLGVYAILITETIMLIPTIMYILNSKTNILKYYMGIIVTMYGLICIFPTNSFIAQQNINRYYKTGKIDLDYLKNYSDDNVKELIELYNKTDDDDLKEKLYIYLRYYKYTDNSASILREKIVILDDDMSIQEFNISKYKAKKLFKKNNFEKR